MRVEINSKITPDDYRALVHFGAYKRQRYVVPLMGIALAVGALQIVEVIYTGTIVYPFAFYSSIAMFVLLAISMYMLKFSTERYIKSDKVTLNADRCLVFNDVGVTGKQYEDKPEMWIEYDHFSDAYEMEDYLILYMNRQNGVVIARRDIPERDMVLLRDKLSQEMGKRFKIRTK